MDEKTAGLIELLHLNEKRPDDYQAETLDQNQNGRVFGGQLLGLAVKAAISSNKDAEKRPTMLQAVFLQGALVDRPIDYTAAAMQIGKRFSTYHISATQGDRSILNAAVSLQVPAKGFEHETPMPDAPAPETLRGIDVLESEIRQKLPAGAYILQKRTHFDMRFVDPDSFLFQPASKARLQYWVKVRHHLPEDPGTQASALAYLSDYWFNYACLMVHTAGIGANKKLYVASLNHSLWFHAPCTLNEWLFFDCESPRAFGTRGFVVGRIFNQAGTLVASAAQECVATAITP